MFSARLSANSASPTPAGTIVLELLFSEPASADPDASTSPRDRFHSLSIREQGVLRSRWGASNVEQLLAISSETDPTIFSEDLLSWARSQEQGGRPESAVTAYALLCRQEGIPEAARRHARQALAVYQGSGPMGARAELFLRNALRETLSPINLLAMTGAGLAFRASRVGFLRLFSEAGLSGGALSVAAAGAAFNAEALAFPLLHRAGNQLVGAPVDWSRAGLQRDLLSSYLFLGGMRAAGFAGTKFLRWGSSVPGANRIFAPNLGVLTASQQLSRWGLMFGGVMGGTYLESLAGLRRFDSRSDFFSHCLATFFQFQLAGRVAQEALGSRFAQMERGLDLLATKIESANPSSRSPYLTGARLPVFGAMATAGAPASFGNPWIAMSQMEIAEPSASHGLNGHLGLPLEPALVSNGPKVLEAVPAEAPSPASYRIAEALVRHRGNFQEAAESLGLPVAEFESEFRNDNPHSEWSVFGKGRMLFYRPALALARSSLGARIFQPQSLQALNLQPETLGFAQRMGVGSLWDLLMTTHADMHHSRAGHEPESVVTAYAAEMERKINAALPNTYGTVFQNHPFGEGAVKVAMGRVFGDLAIADLRLPPEVANDLSLGNFHTVGDLMRRPIPTWIPREFIPEDRLSGTREARVDAIIRSLFSLLHNGSPRPAVPATVQVFSRPAEMAEILETKEFSEAEFVRQLVEQRGDLSKLAVIFSRSPEALRNEIQAAKADSELGLFQTQGQGTMIFYSSALRRAMGEIGASAHLPSSLDRLRISPEGRAQLEVMGVESFRDLMLLTREDLRRDLGAEVASRFEDNLTPQIDQALGQSGLERRFQPFNPGVIKEALGRRFSETPLNVLRLEASTQGLLRANGISRVGDLMRTPIPRWIRVEQLPEGAHFSLKAEYLDHTIRALFALMHS
ncbi:MAG: hypothetical protein K8R69_08830 [Deltaproteobacteria bacterium]|nr:hypothetical protein [Deltaproteobacteria bacterium]